MLWSVISYIFSKSLCDMLCIGYIRAIYTVYVNFVPETVQILMCIDSSKNINIFFRFIRTYFFQKSLASGSENRRNGLLNSHCLGVRRFGKISCDVKICMNWCIEPRCHTSCLHANTGFAD